MPGSSETHEYTERNKTPLRDTPLAVIRQPAKGGSAEYHSGQDLKISHQDTLSPKPNKIADLMLRGKQLRINVHNHSIRPKLRTCI